jgi:hypothetical protein
MAELRQYSPLKVVGTWVIPIPPGTIDILEGAVSTGDFAVIETDSDAWTREVDLAGNATRVRNYNGGGRIRVTLSASSPTNTKLSAAAAADAISENVVGALVLRDLNGNTIVECDGAFLVDIPDFSFGSERGSRTWTWECAAIRPVLGGHDLA